MSAADITQRRAAQTERTHIMTTTTTTQTTQTSARTIGQIVAELDHHEARERIDEITLAPLVRRGQIDRDDTHTARYEARLGGPDGTVIGRVYRHLHYAISTRLSWRIECLDERHPAGSPAAASGRCVTRYADTLAGIRIEALMSADRQGLLASATATDAATETEIEMPESPETPTTEATGMHTILAADAIVAGWSLTVRIRRADGYTSERVRIAIPAEYMPTRLHLREAGERVIRETYGELDGEALWAGWSREVTRADRRAHGDAAPPRYIRRIGETLRLHPGEVERVAAMESVPLSLAPAAPSPAPSPAPVEDDEDDDGRHHDDCCCAECSTMAATGETGDPIERESEDADDDGAAERHEDDLAAAAEAAEDAALDAEARRMYETMQTAAHPADYDPDYWDRPEAADEPGYGDDPDPAEVAAARDQIVSCLIEEGGVTSCARVQDWLEAVGTERIAGQVAGGQLISEGLVTREGPVGIGRTDVTLAIEPDAVPRAWAASAAGLAGAETPAPVTAPPAAAPLRAADAMTADERIARVEAARTPDERVEAVADILTSEEMPVLEMMREWQRETGSGRTRCTIGEAPVEDVAAELDARQREATSEPTPETPAKPTRIHIDMVEAGARIDEIELVQTPAEDEWRDGRYAARIAATGALVGRVHRHYGYMIRRGGAASRQSGWDLRTAAETHRPGTPAAERGDTVTRHGDTLRSVRMEAVESAVAQGLLAAWTDAERDAERAAWQAAQPAPRPIEEHPPGCICLPCFERAETARLERETQRAELLERLAAAGGALPRTEVESGTPAEVLEVLVGRGLIVLRDGLCRSMAGPAAAAGATVQ